MDVLLEQPLVGLRDRLDHPVAVLLSLLAKLFGNLDLVVLRSQRLVPPHPRLHRHQVHDALELVLGAHWDLNGYRAALQPLDDGLDRMEEIRAHAVHLVDEAEARNLVLVRLPPHRLRLRLHASDRVEDRHRAIEHPQAALHLGREIDVARGVDDVDFAVPPFAGGGRRRDRDAALLFLFHVVHDGGAFMNFADLVGTAGVVEDAFSRSGLAGIDVGHDADVPHSLDWYRTRHKLLSHRRQPSAAGFQPDPAPPSAHSAAPDG